jgi:hypothetical protein
MTVMQFFRDGRRHAVRARRVSRVNWPVFWLGQLWWLTETGHYGWHFSPTTDAQMICDGIFILVTALALRPVNGT